MVYNPQQKTCSRTHSKGQILVPSKPNILTEMMQRQKRILLTCSNMENLQQQAKYIESDEVSDDSMDDNSHMQQGRNFKVKEPKFVDSDVVSADAMGYHSDTQLGRELNNKQIEDSKRDGVSEDSICGSSLKQ